MRDIDAEIAAKRAEIAKLEEIKQYREGLTTLQRLAEAVHAVSCHWNHTDWCDWFYGSWKDPRYSHQEALKVAGRLLTVEPDMERIIRILHVIKKPEF